ncbi:DUF3500 domain-containing protein [Saccharothrix coeruleofusca]|uniref:DUF3500 domain-containing protein n=1 Tax=Saccharothrix coeruleofusca TaxID=33919 RepID=UPI0016717D87|nr:DUF3500 domain-containing protein [Saccharothrix coeruleofusca]
MPHEITEAARGFLALLDEGQRETAVRAVDGDLRRRWAYTPGQRPGVPLGGLRRDQRKAAHRLLSSVLSPHAYAQAAAVMALEDVLDDREGGRRDRHQGDYWAVLFGEPGDDAPWGWRVEGHHLSVSVVVADGRVSATPLFLGANPARTAYLGRTVLHPLRLEEELARELLERMGRAGRRHAIVADTPPSDLYTRNAPRVRDVEPRGVTSAQLDRGAREALLALVRYYCDRLRGDLADEEFAALDQDRLHFSWEGSTERGEGHYYRVQGPELLIEYDNTANGANHAHTVWRRRSGDFGEDLLAAHRASVEHG